jgi:hypothetical protein
MVNSFLKLFDLPTFSRPPQIYFRQFHYTTQWNNNLLIPLSGVMKFTYPTEWSNEMRPVMKFLIPLKWVG